MKTEYQVKKDIMEILHEQLEKGFVINESWTHNHFANYTLMDSKGNIVTMITHQDTMGSIYSWMTKITVKIDDVTVYIAHEISVDKGYIYTETREEAWAIDELRKQRFLAQIIDTSGEWRKAPMSLVNRIKKIRGFGKGTQETIQVRRGKGYYGPIVEARYTDDKGRTLFENVIG